MTARTRVPDLDRMARDRFGYKALRPGQEEAIQSLLAGQDTLVLMPTGSGKSAIYQAASLLLRGPTVVISPLIALQQDQVQAIEEHGLGDAATLNSAEPESEREEALDDLEDREVSFLFLAPEQFNNPEVLESLREARPSLFVVDEAHCISEWGHDFRPEYLRLGAVIEELGHPTVLALTATASPPVRKEIMERLEMRDPRIVVGGFDRPNIWLGVEHFHDERTKRETLLERVGETEGPGIVYVSTKRHADEIAEALRACDIQAEAYHAGMSARDREATQTAFMEDRLAVIVATIAFGMGVDKPNVRFVFHYDVSDSLDSYYQEIGRAGRDGEGARALLFYRPEDLGIHRFFAGTGKVDAEQMEQVARAVERHHGPVDPDEIREETELSGAKVATAITRLEEAGAIETLPTGEIVVVEDPGEDTTDAADAAAEAERRHRAFNQSRIEMMRGYAEDWDCRREFLLNYFGEAFDPPCGRCDNCQAGRVARETEGNVPFPLNTRVSHKTLGEGLVERYEGDTMTVLFDDVGYRTLDLQFVTENEVLESV